MPIRRTLSQLRWRQWRLAGQTATGEQVRDVLVRSLYKPPLRPGVGVEGAGLLPYPPLGIL